MKLNDIQQGDKIRVNIKRVEDDYEAVITAVAYKQDAVGCWFSEQGVIITNPELEPITTVELLDRPRKESVTSNDNLSFYVEDADQDILAFRWNKHTGSVIVTNTDGDELVEMHPSTIKQVISILDGWVC